MSEIGSEALLPTAPVPDRLGQESPREPAPRARRVPPPPAAQDPQPPDPAEVPPHQVDSLA